MITLRFRNLSVALSLFLVWSLSAAIVQPLRAQDQPPQAADRRVPAAEALKQITEDYDDLAFGSNLSFPIKPECPHLLGTDLSNSEVQAQAQGLRSRQEFLTYHRSALSKTMSAIRSQGYAKAADLARLNEGMKALKERVAQAERLEREESDLHSQECVLQDRIRVSQEKKANFPA